MFFDVSLMPPPGFMPDSGFMSKNITQWEKHKCIQKGESLLASTFTDNVPGMNGATLNGFVNIGLLYSQILGPKSDHIHK